MHRIMKKNYSQTKVRCVAAHPVRGALRHQQGLNPIQLAYDGGRPDCQRL